ncbi:hypothetical protein QFZ23_003650 [Arthrobacter globiformis]|nr:hypothetical protein [Arthrobacter globiformis]
MPWTRLDDGWTEQSVIAALSFEARWHYLCLIQFCSRTKRFDGYIRAVDAKRCSDVTEPDAALKQLTDVGLILFDDQGGYVVHRMEEDHAPPPWVRNRTESNKQAKRRQRSHDAGDHSLCLPGGCQLAPTPNAARHADIRAEGDADIRADGHADIRADGHADIRADSQDRTGQDRLRTESFKGPDSSSRDRRNLAVDPAAWPTDEVGLEWRNFCEEKNVTTVQALMAESPQLKTENQARKVLMMAYPGQKF